MTATYREDLVRLLENGTPKTGIMDHVMTQWHVERDLIRTRTAEGRSRAKARAQHMGCPPKLTAVQKAEARQRRAEGATPKELALSYNVARATISRLGV
jgi:DNA invertase Pin-like site-specific DNA recombinase